MSPEDNFDIDDYTSSQEIRQTLEDEEKKRRRFKQVFSIIAAICILSFAYSLIASINLSNINRDQLAQQEANRVQARLALCNLLNNNSNQANKLTDVIDNIILTSTQASKAFEKTYIQLGLPPYKDRLAKAEIQIKQLSDTKVAVLNCQAFAHKK